MECVDPKVDNENNVHIDEEEMCGIQLIKSYEANDLFYAIAWSYDQNNQNAPLIALGGEEGVIRVISMHNDCSKSIVIHGRLT